MENNKKITPLDFVNRLKELYGAIEDRDLSKIEMDAIKNLLNMVDIPCNLEPHRAGMSIPDPNFAPIEREWSIPNPNYFHKCSENICYNYTTK